ncbi:4-aminobutyrate aminotransferase [Motilibacter rhizosphaerae]|uniref:alanine--glyoxylate transaminase n=1 Tax=Motilibacter rhizosphaerae TaxID=598652 RepID=A0A4Q7NS55_9ACTN|nr:aminotransferase class III-fold pyridoxal phosphate-dependent enzyme [Motilibacter rhizosphaerae]RZS89608.1 4-aminobutyrate aminotransferase [Motilibacter rhizosphaerae]
MTEVDLLARHRAVLPSWLSLYYQEPLEIVSGKGNRVVGADGRTYLDFFAGILTNMVGYDLPEVREAVEAQLRTGVVHTSTLYLLRSQVELAEKIARISGIPDARVFFTNSGTEANEAALLLATAYRRSNQVIALRNSYHGRGFGTTSVTGNRGWSPSSLSPFSVLYAQGGYRFRSSFRGFDDAAFVAACVTDLRELLATASAGDVACLIAEPVQGVGGFAVPPDGLLKAYEEVLDETGTLLISDEVQTGWGRTGEHFWGYQASGVTPDLLTFAKGVGGGFAMGGVVGRAEVMDCLQANSISTFGGNPVATAAANAVLDYVLSHDLQASAAKLGTRLLDGLREAAARLPFVGEVRGKGLMVGIELVGPDGYAPAPAAAAAVLEQTRRSGLLVGKGGLHGNVLRVAPPLTITAEEVEEGLAILVGALESVQRDL